MILGVRTARTRRELVSEPGRDWVAVWSERPRRGCSAGVAWLLRAGVGGRKEQVGVGSGRAESSQARRKEEKETTAF